VIGKSGQYSVVYYLVMIVISLSLLSGFLYLSGNLQTEAGEEFSMAIMENLVAGLNKNVGEIRVIAEMSNSSNITKIMRVPALIGNEKYYMYGRKNITVAKIVGEEWTDIEDFYSWSGKEIRGLVYGGAEKVKINYSSSDPGNVTIS
jgi:hypothetical protein